MQSSISINVTVVLSNDGRTFPSVSTLNTDICTKINKILTDRINAEELENYLPNVSPYDIICGQDGSATNTVPFNYPTNTFIPGNTTILTSSKSTFRYNLLPDRASFQFWYSIDGTDYSSNTILTPPSPPDTGLFLVNHMNSELDLDAPIYLYTNSINLVFLPLTTVRGFTIIPSNSTKKSRVSLVGYDWYGDLTSFLSPEAMVSQALQEIGHALGLPDTFENTFTDIPYQNRLHAYASTTPNNMGWCSVYSDRYALANVNSPESKVSRSVGIVDDSGDHEHKYIYGSILTAKIPDFEHALFLDGLEGSTYYSPDETTTTPSSAPAFTFETNLPLTSSQLEPYNSSIRKAVVVRYNLTTLPDPMQTETFSLNSFSHFGEIPITYFRITPAPSNVADGYMIVRRAVDHLYGKPTTVVGFAYVDTVTLGDLERGGDIGNVSELVEGSAVVRVGVIPWCHGPIVRTLFSTTDFSTTYTVEHILRCNAIEDCIPIATGSVPKFESLNNYMDSSIPITDARTFSTQQVEHIIPYISSLATEPAELFVYIPGETGGMVSIPIKLNPGQTYGWGFGYVPPISFDDHGMVLSMLQVGAFTDTPGTQYVGFPLSFPSPFTMDGYQTPSGNTAELDNLTLTGVSDASGTMLVATTSVIYGVVCEPTVINGRPILGRYEAKVKDAGIVGPGIITRPVASGTFTSSISGESTTFTMFQLPPPRTVKVTLNPPPTDTIINNNTGSFFVPGMPIMATHGASLTYADAPSIDIPLTLDVLWSSGIRYHFMRYDGQVILIAGLRLVGTVDAGTNLFSGTITGNLNIGYGATITFQVSQRSVNGLFIFGDTVIATNPLPPPVYPTATTWNTLSVGGAVVPITTNPAATIPIIDNPIVITSSITGPFLPNGSVIGAPFVMPPGGIVMPGLSSSDGTIVGPVILKDLAFSGTASASGTTIVTPGTLSGTVIAGTPPVVIGLYTATYDATTTSSSTITGGVVTPTVVRATYAAGGVSMGLFSTVGTVSVASTNPIINFPMNPNLTPFIGIGAPLPPETALLQIEFTLPIGYLRIPINLQSILGTVHIISPLTLSLTTYTSLTTPRAVIGTLTAPLENNEGTLRFSVSSNSLSGPLFMDTADSVIVMNNLLSAPRTASYGPPNNIIPWSSIAYGNTVFISVSNEGYIMRSTDTGATWTPPMLFSQSNAIAYGGNDTFVSMGTTNIRISTDDGVTWITRNNPFGTDFSVTPCTSIAYGNGRFVAVTDTSSAVPSLTLGSVIESTDNGQTFTLQASPLNKWNAVAYGDGTFVAVGASSSTFDSPIMISRKNGSGGMDAWELVSNLASDIVELEWSSIIFGNGTFIATSRTSDKYIKSIDGGGHWQVGSFGSNINVNHIVFGSGLFFAPLSPGTHSTGGNPAIVSKDGWTNWNTISLGGDSSTEYGSSAYGNGSFISVPKSSGTQVAIIDRIRPSIRIQESNPPVPNWSLSTMLPAQTLIPATNPVLNHTFDVVASPLVLSPIYEAPNTQFTGVPVSITAPIRMPGFISSSSSPLELFSPVLISGMTDDTGSGWVSGSSIYGMIRTVDSTVVIARYEASISPQGGIEVGMLQTCVASGSMVYDGNTTFVHMFFLPRVVNGPSVPINNAPLATSVSNFQQGVPILSLTGAPLPAIVDVNLTLAVSGVDGISLPFLTGSPTITTSLRLAGTTSSLNDRFSGTITASVGSGETIYIPVSGMSSSGSLLCDRPIVLTSPLPLTPWSAMQNGTGFPLHSITYGSERFVAAGIDESVIKVLSSGLKWVSAKIRFGLSSPDGRITVSALAFGGGVCVALPGIRVGGEVINHASRMQTTTITSTAPGGTWEPVLLPPTSGPINGVAFGGGTFVAVSQSGNIAGRVIISTNLGVSWSQIEFPESLGTEWKSIAYGASKFVAVGVNPTDPSKAIMTSETGLAGSWTFTGPGDLLQPPGNYAWSSVTFGNGVFVTVAEDGPIDGPRVATSSNGGVTWNPPRSISPAISHYPWKCITFGLGYFVAVSHRSTTTTSSATMVSMNGGITWSLQEITTESLKSKDWTSVAFGNGSFVAVSPTMAENGIISDSGDIMRCGIPFSGGSAIINIPPSTSWTTTPGTPVPLVPGSPSSIPVIENPISLVLPPFPPNANIKNLKVSIPPNIPLTGITATSGGGTQEPIRMKDMVISSSASTSTSGEFTSGTVISTLVNADGSVAGVYTASVTMGGDGILRIGPGTVQAPIATGTAVGGTSIGMFPLNFISVSVLSPTTIDSSGVPIIGIGEINLSPNTSYHGLRLTIPSGTGSPIAFTLPPTLGGGKTVYIYSLTLDGTTTSDTFNGVVVANLEGGDGQLQFTVSGELDGPLTVSDMTLIPPPPPQPRTPIRKNGQGWVLVILAAAVFLLAIGVWWTRPRS